jgi:murein DD-endopeptidase MepM/ murein hydrolase activator NlpD
MDKKKKSFSSFIAGKGFYIALFLCVAAIGISGYIILFSDSAKTDTEDVINGSQSEANEASGDVDDSSLLSETVPILDEDADAFLEEKESEVLIIDDDASEVSASNDQSAEAMYSQPAAQPATSVSNVQDQNSGYRMPVTGTIGQGHSMDVLVYNPTLDDWRTHSGIDIITEAGAPVSAAADGVVSKVYLDDMLGNVVVIGHEDGMSTLYANLAPELCVEEGWNVSGGDVLGFVGTSALREYSLEPHLHFEMYYEDTLIDPLEILPTE